MSLGCVFFLGILWAVGGLAQEPKVRTSLATKEDPWVGQRITFVVELLAPGYFAGAPSFDLPSVPGLLLIPPSGSPVVSSEMIDDTNYTVQRHELSVFARRAGEVTVPSYTVRFHFKRQPLDHDAVSATVKTAPLPLKARVPPGAEKLGSVISARDLKVDETWKPEPGRAKTGDAFTRTITYTAPDVPAMAFPPFPAGKIDGVGIYPKAPEVLDHSERGSLSGERRETITYVCQRSGSFVIPAVRMTWFDLEAQKLQTIDLPARTLEVAPNPALTPVAAASAPATNRAGRSLAMGLLLALGVNGLAFLFWKTRRIWWPVIEAFRPVHLAPLNPRSGPK